MKKKESQISEIDKQESEKKYYSKKSELKKKTFEVKKALIEDIKEVEEDFEKVVKNEPDLLSEEDKKGYKEYVAKKEKEIKSEIENLEFLSNELELDYEDLKTEPKVDMLIEYSKSISHAVNINSPLMKMVFDYFNYLNDNKKSQEKANIKIDHFTNEKGLPVENFPHNTNMDYYIGNVVIKFKGKERIFVTLKKYFEQGKGFCFFLCFASEGKTYLNPEYIGKKILFNSITHSKIKGSYITLPPESIMWLQERLERRTFSDIFLPKSTMDDLNLYTKLYDKTGKLLRYLMIGNPGTCKTEATLAIANYLKDSGVTIIKTTVCSSLKEKIELAELLAPSLLILDDLDLSLGSRKKGVVSGGLAQFLDVLDGTEKLRKDVGIIATTNSLELIDIAASRPGRFDKLLSFDRLTVINIKNVILKSLRYNFEIESNSVEVLPFINEEVLNEFNKSKVTGSHIYNTVKMLYLRIQTLELTDITPEWVVEQITKEIETISRMRKTDYLSDKMSGGSSNSVGYGSKHIEEDEEEEIDVPVECVDKRTSGMAGEIFEQEVKNQNFVNQ